MEHTRQQVQHSTHYLLSWLPQLSPLQLLRRYIYPNGCSWLNYFAKSFFETLNWTFALFFLFNSYAPARVACSAHHKLCWWNQQGPRWLKRTREWDSHARPPASPLMIECQTWVRGNSWICFCWGLFHSPQVSCWFLMGPSLSQLGKVSPFFPVQFL